MAGGIVVAAVEARAGRAFPLLAATDSWVLPAHDLAATRHGGQIDGARVVWRAQLAGGVAGAPAIVGGRVFAASIGGAVASLDLRTGRARWQRRLPTPAYGSGKSVRRLGFFGGVAVAQGRVFAASDRVVSLDADTAERSGKASRCGRAPATTTSGARLSSRTASFSSARARAPSCRRRGAG